MNRVFALVNPIVVALAQSFLHGLISHQIVVLEFKGRRSGRGYALPVSFVRNDGEVFCMTDRKGIWWRNLQGAVPVQLTLAGRTVQATACVEVDDEQQIGAALRLFCLRSRISAFFAGVSIEKDGEPNSADLARSARQQILIKLSVDG